MRRRSFIASVGSLVATASFCGTDLGGTEPVGSARAASTIDYLEFDSTASLLAADGSLLTDGSVVAVYAESTAENEDADGNGDATLYGSTAIPLVAVDRSRSGTVVGFGATLVSNQANFRAGNEEFVLNVWDAEVGGSGGNGGTVLYDEGHGQYHSLSDFSNMANYAENNGYAVQATTDVASDLGSADAVWITGPASAFSSSEQDAIADFVANGGSVFLHDRADYSDYDETGNLNDLAEALSLPFSFNDDQVVDWTYNTDDTYYRPTTNEFDTSFDYFADRPGMGIDPDATHTVSVLDVTDGDTVDVEFDSGRVEAVRVLGIDTPETSSNSQYERVQEWEGIESTAYLETWGANATTFGQDELSNATVDLSFDDAEPGIFDPYDRLLGYIHYDATGDGARDDFYNYRTVQEGYARLYSSSFSNHESFWDAEAAAQANGTGVWAESDPENSTQIRNRAVDDLFFPTPSSVRTTGGAIDPSRVPVAAESTASQSGGSVSYSGDIPLVGVDESANVAVVGSPLVDESYELAEDYPVDTSGYENFVFLTNLIDYLADSGTDGQVLVDGGHGQFTPDWALSAEDAAYYQRYLEGVGIAFEQVNTLSTDTLSRGRVLVVTSPPDSFTSTEQSNVAAFRDDGGAVVMVGASGATSTARTNLNDLASALGTDLRVTDDSVTDGSNNVNGDSSVPTTTAFDASFPLFDAYDGSGGGGGSGELSVQTVHADAEGDEYDNLNDEYVVFENTGTAALDLTGYAVEDEAAHHYEFPSGFSLDAGATVTLHTGSGTDTVSDCYWGSSSPVWNNAGDTVYAFDDAGTQVLAYSY